MKPILFNTEMVRATQREENPKTQTRRIVKYNKEILNPQIGFTAFTDPGDFSVRGTHENGKYGESFFPMPIKVGDVLYVREKWRMHSWVDCVMYIEFAAEPDKLHAVPAPYDDMELREFWQRYSWKKGWNPSLFLPKRLARNFLKVTAVKAERLTDISEADAIAEGVEMLLGESGWSCWKDYIGHKSGASCSNAVSSFETLWKSINGPESWGRQPLGIRLHLRKNHQTRIVHRSKFTVQ